MLPPPRVKLFHCQALVILDEEKRVNARVNSRSNEFYRDHFQKLIIALVVAIFLMLGMLFVVLYQLSHRPLPVFYATNQEGRIRLVPYFEPNLLPSTLLQWASKATVAAYTFDFVNYNRQIAQARPYFTSAGWDDYQRSISNLISTITKNQLFVNGVVSGPPIIVNQGDLEGRGYLWRLQLPFLVTYQSAETLQKQSFTVILTIKKIPTTENPSALGIDQFVMV